MIPVALPIGEGRVNLWRLFAAERMGLPYEKNSRNGGFLMGRPAKTYEVLMGEGKSHRTKSELEMRKNAEKSLLTGEKMRESAAVRADKAAHGHWLRVKKLMAAIGRDDAIHENGINRYCLMLSECEALLAEKARLNAERDELRGMIETLRRAERAGKADDGRMNGGEGGASRCGESAALRGAEAEGCGENGRKTAEAEGCKRGAAGRTKRLECEALGGLTERRIADGWDERQGAQCAKYEARCDALLLAAMKIEAALEKKRAMLLSIEKENLLTVAAGLRAVPKKPPEEQADSMAALLGMRPARRG